MKGHIEEPLTPRRMTKRLFPDTIAPQMREKFACADEEAFGVPLSDRANDEALNVMENAYSRDGP
ncbi:hypothetical protein [Methylosinus sporium]|uniref:hypothetical protein n=1 Tax=Methylosinus sporium TaxID=428 RepID=UPI00383BAE1E